MPEPIPAGARYVAMGSSFAAGPGLQPRVAGSPRRAGRSTRNYAHIVAAELGLTLNDVTFSGATTADLLATQLDAVAPDTRLVTITGGGNDVGYLPRLTLASLPWPVAALPRIRARVADFGDPGAADTRFSALERNLAAITERLRERAPAARVLFVGYLTILPPQDPPRPPPADVAAWGRTIAARLAATTEAAATAAGYEWVPVPAASAGHHAWSQSPWTRRFHLSLRGGAPYHPNVAGMGAVARLVLAHLGHDPAAA